MAYRKTRAGRMSRVHRAGDDSIGRPEVRSTLPAPIQDQELMSHQHGLSNNGTQTTGFTEPDDGDDRVQKESENVVHSRMVSNGRSSRIQDLWRIRLPQDGTTTECRNTS